MSLTRAQTEFIQNAIDHLLDFPTDQDDLLASTEQLLAGMVDRFDDSNEQYQLIRCLFSPEEILQRLEDLNEADKQVSVGSVQVYILELITTHLKKASQACGLDLEDIGWDQEKINRENLPAWHNQKTFTSRRPAAQAVSLPWEHIKEHEGSIYTGSLQRNSDDLEWVKLHIKIELPYETHVIEIARFERYNDQEDEYDAMLNLVSLAKEMASLHAVNALKIALLYQQIASTDLITKIAHDPEKRNLVLDQFYLDMIFEKQLSLTEIAPLKPDQIELLLSRQAKILLTNTRCTFQEVCLATPTKLALISSYQALIESGAFGTKNLLSINKIQAKTLSLPVVHHSIVQSKMTFIQACNLPECAHQLLISPLYADYMLNQPINWSIMTLLKNEHVHLLLNPNIAGIIKDKDIPLDLIALLTNEQVELMSTKSFQSLIQQNILTITDLSHLNQKSVLTLRSNPLIQQGMLAKAINVNDIYIPVCLDQHQVGVLTSINIIYDNLFRNRLSSLLDQCPFTFCDKEDNVELITDDLILIHEMNGVNIAPICKSMMGSLATKMHYKAFEWSLTLANSANKPFINKLLGMDFSSVMSDEKGLNQLKEVINDVHERLKTISSQKKSPTLFAPAANMPTPSLLNFLRCLAQFKPLIEFSLAQYANAAAAPRIHSPTP